MHKNALVGALGLFTICLVGTSMSYKNPNNPPLGYTGAPGEQTCQKASCHGGGNFVGTPSLSGLPDSIVAGESYLLTLSLESNCTKAGFELTCLDADDVKAGTFSAGTGTSVANFGGKQYVRQSAPKTLAAGTTSWNFTWNAPETVGGDAVTFYFSTLNANGNGNDSGDNAIKGDTTIPYKMPEIILDASTMEAPSISIGPNPAKDHITIQHAAAGSTMDLYDLHGKHLMHKAIDAVAVTYRIGDLPAGNYAVVISNGAQTVTKQITIQ
jgi:hypothetical protein